MLIRYHFNHMELIYLYVMCYNMYHSCDASSCKQWVSSRLCIAWTFHNTGADKLLLETARAKYIFEQTNILYVRIWGYKPIYHFSTKIPQKVLHAIQASYIMTQLCTDSIMYILLLAETQKHPWLPKADVPRRTFLLNIHVLLTQANAIWPLVDIHFIAWELYAYYSWSITWLCSFFFAPFYFCYILCWPA